MVEPLVDLAYLALTAAVTFLTSRSLQRRGVESLATFYLASFGFIAFFYPLGRPKTLPEAVDQLSLKLGVILLLLALLHAVKRRMKTEVKS